MKAIPNYILDNLRANSSMLLRASIRYFFDLLSEVRTLRLEAPVKLPPGVPVVLRLWLPAKLSSRCTLPTRESSQPFMRPDRISIFRLLIAA